MDRVLIGLLLYVREGIIFFCGRSGEGKKFVIGVWRVGFSRITSLDNRIVILSACVLFLM